MHNSHNGGTKMIPTQESLAAWPRIVAHRVFVTPDMAAEWLAATNTGNRHIRPGVVQRYVNIMKGGGWQATHQGVAFSNKRLIDGQHRLTAIVQSGVPQWMAVFTDQQDDTFGVLDKGTNRSLRDEVPMPSQVLDAVSWMAQILGDTQQNRQVNPAYAKQIGAVWGDVLTELICGNSPSTRGRVVAATRSAMALRLFYATGEAREYLMRQWRAWVSSEFSDMSPSLQAGYKRIANVTHANTRSGSIERACVAWVAFDPHNRGLTRVSVRDAEVEIAEMRAVFEAAMKGATP